MQRQHPARQCGVARPAASIRKRATIRRPRSGRRASASRRSDWKAVSGQTLSEASRTEGGVAADAWAVRGSSRDDNDTPRDSPACGRSPRLSTGCPRQPRSLRRLPMPAKLCCRAWSPSQTPLPRIHCLRERTRPFPRVCAALQGIMKCLRHPPARLVLTMDRRRGEG